MEKTLCAAVLAKIVEQIERTDHLIGLLGPEQLGAPVAGSWAVARLLGHLLDTLAGFCAALYAADPSGLAHFAELRGLEVNHACTRDEARDRIAQYRAHIEEAFSLLTDADLARTIPTVFVPEGEALLTLLLGNLEHLINHKYQLFGTLKQTGIHVGTRDLYHFRGVG